jgi:hypothetical protein
VKDIAALPCSYSLDSVHFHNSLFRCPLPLLSSHLTPRPSPPPTQPPALYVSLLSPWHPLSLSPSHSLSLTRLTPYRSLVSPPISHSSHPRRTPQDLQAILALSQTFYFQQEDSQREKVFSRVRQHKLWQNAVLWGQLLLYAITEDLNRFPLFQVYIVLQV